MTCGVLASTRTSGLIPAHSCSCRVGVRRLRPSPCSRCDAMQTRARVPMFLQVRLHTGAGSPPRLGKRPPDREHSKRRRGVRTPRPFGGGRRGLCMRLCRPHSSALSAGGARCRTDQFFAPGERRSFSGWCAPSFSHWLLAISYFWDQPHPRAQRNRADSGRAASLKLLGGRAAAGTSLPSTSLRRDQARGQPHYGSLK